MKRIEIGGKPVEIRRLPRARRLTLRLRGSDGAAVLTVPMRVTEAQMVAFLHEKQAWIAAAQARLPQPVWVKAGSCLPVEGQKREIRTAGILRPSLQEGALYIPQAQERRAGAVVATFLTHLATERFAAAVARHTVRLGVAANGISLRDTRSRWGSCSHDGKLMFSWRVVMAPPEVLDYLAAHEVAHLRHFDHSPAFWASVAELCPDFRALKDWLRREGAGLHRFRFDR